MDDALELNKREFKRVQMQCMRAHGAAEASELTKVKLKNSANTRDLLVTTILKEGMCITKASEEVTFWTYNLFDDFHVLRHSCNPNAHVLIKENEEDHQRMELRATKKIVPGDEILHCQGNPFQKKEGRRALPGAQNCSCQICSDTQEKGEPNEELYCDLEQKLTMISDFRGYFFRPDEVVDLSDAHQNERLFIKAANINAISRAKRDRIRAACQWIKERKDKYKLMHACFAEV